MARLLDPARIAVVGVSSDPTKHGSRIVRHLKRFGFGGEIWGVNPRRPDVDGISVFGSLEELPQPPDIVASAVPATATAGVVRRAGAIGAQTVVVFASGFAEVGEAGGRLQSELIEAADSAQVRILGPNSGGVIRPSRGLALSFLTCLDRPEREMRSGRVGLVTQSGGTGSYLHNLAAARGGGLAASVSTGNEADIEAAEAIQALAELEEVHAVAVVLEAVRNGPGFIAALDSLTAKGIPVVVCRIGTSEHGREMMRTHTGAMAHPRAVLEGVLDAGGATVAETPAEMLEVAEIVASASPAAGDRAAVVTHSGGVAILLADLATRHGLSLPPPGAGLQAKLEPLLDLGVAGNPLDMGAIIGGPQRFTDVVRIVMQADEYDSVLAVTTAHPPAHTTQRVDGLLALPTGKPLVHLWMAGDLGAEGLGRLRAGGKPITEEPRAAIRAMAALGRPVARPGDTDDPPLEESPNPMPARPTERDAKVLLRGWGIPTVEGELAETADEAGRSATRLGFPVAVKLHSPDVEHKARAGGVILDVTDEASAAAAFERVMASAGDLLPEADLQGVLVERYRPGPEAVIGAVVDPIFGPVVLVGAGGIRTEELGLTAIAPAPLSRAAAVRLVRRSGLAGLPAADADSPDFGLLAELASRLSRHFVAHANELAEVEINPIIWTGQRWEAADALVRLHTSRAPSGEHHSAGPGSPFV